MTQPTEQPAASTAVPEPLSEANVIRLATLLYSVPDLLTVAGWDEHVDAARRILATVAARGDGSLVLVEPDMVRPTEQPAAGHVIHVTAEDDAIRLHIDCHEPAGTFCRTSPDGVTGGCYAVEWFDLCMLTELHDPDVGPESLSDGMPVTVSWNGDVESWVWRTGVPAAAECVA